ncbi:MAG: hypothetical protein KGL39_46975 [Patescibacteria group bacterium]|nr:hypothetical protein [Patescibacteria group bacterium]
MDYLTNFGWQKGSAGVIALLIMRCLLIPVHGINATNNGWVGDFCQFIKKQWPEAVIIEPDYFATALPIFNNWFLDPHVSKCLFQKILFNAGTLPIFFVAHSNGAVITLRTAQLLIAKGKTVAGMVLIAGAIDPDIAETQLLHNVTAKQLGFAAAYCSADDDVLGAPHWLPKWLQTPYEYVKWPYGSLGHTGWQVGAHEYNGPGFITRWRDGGHGAWTDSDRQAVTFPQIVSDLENL